MVTAVLAVLSGAYAQESVIRLDDEEVYRVYASLLPNEWPTRVARAKTLVLQEETEIETKCMPSGTPGEMGWRIVVEDFQRQKATVRRILPARDIGSDYVVVAKADLREIFEADLSDSWRSFYDRFPDSGGITYVSAVGFDPAKTRAMVYVAHVCGRLCGGGTHHFLEKQDGVWREVEVPGVEQCVWMS